MFTNFVICAVLFAVVSSYTIDEDAYIHSKEYRDIIEREFKNYIKELNEKRAKLPRQEVCYVPFGCFSNAPPYDNALGNVPEDPAVLQTRFLLYTRENRDAFDLLSYNDPKTILESHFDSSRKTQFLMHGYMGNGLKEWVNGIVQAALNKEDVNMIAVDWENGAGRVNYWQSAANCRIVGAEIAYLIKMMNSYTGTSEKQFHLIGFSLGAHVAGYAGEELPGLEHITGLDPANPWFEGEDPLVRLDPSDANFVDVIHTNGGDWWRGYVGTTAPCGHVDVYPNGGSLQPGCRRPIGGAIEAIIQGKYDELFKIAGCNHYRAVYLFAHALNYPACNLASFGCDNYENFKAGQCADGGMTQVAQTEAFPFRGVGYGDTFSQEDGYCGYHFHIGITLPSWSSRPDGEIFATLVSSSGSETKVQMANGEIPSGQETAVLSLSPSVLYDVTHVTLSYIKGWFERSSFDVTRVSVRDYERSLSWTYCGEVTVKHDKPVTVQMTAGEC